METQINNIRVDGFLRAHSLTREQHEAATQRRDKADTLAHYTGQLAVTDPRIAQLVALFGRCDERGKQTLLAMGAVQAKFAEVGS